MPRPCPKTICSYGKQRYLGRQIRPGKVHKNCSNGAVSRSDGIVLLGGIYSLRMTFTDKYPEKPPHIRFTTEMFHPNVFADGQLCLDIIQDKWSPIYSVSSILTSIQVRSAGCVLAMHSRSADHAACCACAVPAHGSELFEPCQCRGIACLPMRPKSVQQESAALRRTESGT